MRSGVSFPSVAAEAVYTSVTGAMDANFPIANLSDLKAIRRVARRSSNTGWDFTFLLAASRSVQLVALCQHNASAAETVRVRLFSDNNPDPVGNAAHIVYDSTAVLVWPTGSSPSPLNRWVRPIVLPAAVNALSGHISLSSRAGTDGLAWEIGGVEISGWWEWKDVSVPRELGIISGAQAVDVGGGVSHMTTTWSPKRWAGVRNVVDQSEVETTALDFMREKGRGHPFVFVYDADDATTWNREVMLVCNQTLPPAKLDQTVSGQVAYEFREHLG